MNQLQTASLSRKLERKIDARMHIEQAEPSSQKPPKPERQFCLVAEIHDMQRATWGEKRESMRDARAPGWDHRQCVGNENSFECGAAKQVLRIKGRGIAARQDDCP